MNLALHPDGKRFAVFESPKAQESERNSVHVTFLLNFFDYLRRRIPTGKYGGGLFREDPARVEGK
jgi:hypothetical protein